MSFTCAVFLVSLARLLFTQHHATATSVAVRGNCRILLHELGWIEHLSGSESIMLQTQNHHLSTNLLGPPRPHREVKGSCPQTGNRKFPLTPNCDLLSLSQKWMKRFRNYIWCYGAVNTYRHKLQRTHAGHRRSGFTDLARGKQLHTCSIPEYRLEGLK